MPGEYELRCRDLPTVCGFAARAETVERVIEVTAAHAAEIHGMMSFPPRWWAEMRRHVRTVEEYKELRCEDVAAACGFIAQAETVEGVVELIAVHIAEIHGVKSLPPLLRDQMSGLVRTVQV